MDLSKQCANCGCWHHGTVKPEEGSTVAKCPRCFFPIGYPVQRLTVANEDGSVTPILQSKWKTEEQMNAEKAEADRLQAEKEAADTPPPDDAPQPSLEVQAPKPRKTKGESDVVSEA